MNKLPDTPRHLADDDSRGFKIRTKNVGAYAKMATGQDIDLDVRRADVVQGRRQVMLDPGDLMFIAGTASSDVKDRMGDVLDANCQKSMLEQARGMTIFSSHGYTIPEDVLGVCVASSLNVVSDRRRGDVLDLDIVVQMDTDSPRAVKTWKHVQNGVKLGFSVGGVFTDVTIADEDDWQSGLIVHGIDLLEISLVGLPANPRAYTKFVSEMTRGFKQSLATVAKTLAPADCKRADVRQFVTKSLLTGMRPEGIQMPKHLSQRAAGTRDDANQDPLGKTVPENPNATPTADRPVKPEDNNQLREGQGYTPSVGPPNGDEPSPVPQIGTPGVTGIGQPQEANPVSPNNAAPVPARFLTEPIEEGFQSQDHLKSRVEQHAEMGKEDAPSGAALMAAHDEAESGVGTDTDPKSSGISEKKGFVPSTFAMDEGATEDSAAPALDNELQKKRVVRGMRVLKKAAGMHMDSMGHVVKAHGIMKSMMPAGYAYPEDALLGDNTGGMTSASLSQLEQRSLVLDSEITAKTAKIKELEEKLAQLHATPNGRQSANPGGSIRTGSEPSIDASAYYKTPEQLSADFQRSILNPESRMRPR